MRRLTLLAVTGLALAGPSAASAADVNHDKLPDRWERAHHLSLKVNEAQRDQDRDGLVNTTEYADHTDPRSADSDGDGIKDGHEDADHDGVTNLAEQHATDAGSSSTGTGDGDHAPGGGTPAPSAPTPTPPPATSPPPGGDGSHEPGSGTHTAVDDHVGAYAQGPGYGGPLTLVRSDASSVVAALAESTALRCSAASPSGPYAPCPASRLVAGARVVYAAHAPAADGTETWTTVLILGPAPADPTATQPTLPPALPPAPAATGQVGSFTGGVLTIDRPNGSEHPSGTLAPDAVITCVHVHEGKVTSTAACGADQLVPGRKVALAQRSSTGTWTRIALLVQE